MKYSEQIQVKWRGYAWGINCNFVWLSDLCQIRCSLGQTVLHVETDLFSSKPMRRIPLDSISSWQKPKRDRNATPKTLALGETMRAVKVNRRDGNEYLYTWIGYVGRHLHKEMQRNQVQIPYLEAWCGMTFLVSISGLSDTCLSCLIVYGESYKCGIMWVWSCVNSNMVYFCWKNLPEVTLMIHKLLCSVWSGFNTHVYKSSAAKVRSFIHENFFFICFWFRMFEFIVYCVHYYSKALNTHTISKLWCGWGYHLKWKVKIKLCSFQPMIIKFQLIFKQ